MLSSLVLQAATVSMAAAFVVGSLLLLVGGGGRIAAVLTVFVSVFTFVS